MEIAVLLLLIAPFACASPLRLTQRLDADPLTSEDAVQASDLESSEVTQVQHVPALKIIPFQLEEDNHPDMDALKHRMEVKLRPRRVPQRPPQRGCQLGTCQLHNLANTLYHISKTNGKDESKKANDPQGYGR